MSGYNPGKQGRRDKRQGQHRRVHKSLHNQVAYDKEYDAAVDLTQVTRNKSDAEKLEEFYRLLGDNHEHAISELRRLLENKR